MEQEPLEEEREDALAAAENEAYIAAQGTAFPKGMVSLGAVLRAIGVLVWVIGGLIAFIVAASGVVAVLETLVFTFLVGILFFALGRILLNQKALQRTLDEIKKEVVPQKEDETGTDA